MKSQTSYKNARFVKGFAVALVLASSAVFGISAQAADDSPPNPFANLDKAQQQVTSYEKADPNGPINLHSTDVDYILGRLTTVLALTADQQSNVKSILTDQNARVSATEKNSSLNRVARNTRVDAIYRNTDDRLAKSLTSDQLLKAKVIQSQAIADPDDQRMQKLFVYDARIAAMEPGAAAAQWGTALNLTTTQQLALLPTIKTEISQLDALAADKSVSATESRIRTQEIMIATEHKIDDQLTPEQKTHLESAILFGDMPGSENPRAAKH